MIKKDIDRNMWGWMWWSVVKRGGRKSDQNHALYTNELKIKIAHMIGAQTTLRKTIPIWMVLFIYI